MENSYTQNTQVFEEKEGFFFFFFPIMQRKDYTGFTLLDASPVAGLEIRLPESGKWIAIDELPGSLVVNSGDLISRWTSDVFHSTLHRVRKIEGLTERRSIVFFSGPNDATVIKSKKYSNVVAGEYLRDKILGSRKD